MTEQARPQSQGNLKELHAAKAARTTPASDEDRVKSFENGETDDGSEVNNEAATEETAENEADDAADDDSGNEGENDSGNAEETAEEGDSDAEEDAGEAEKKPSDADKAKPSKKKTFKQRVNELTREKYDAIRRAEEAEARAAELERQAQQPPAKKDDDVNKETSKKPNPDDFEYGELDTGYIEAVSEWKADQKLAAFKQELEQDRQKEAVERRAQELRKKASEIEARGFEKYDDFAEKVVALNVEFSPEVAEVFLDSDVAEDIIYELASDPSEAARIAALSPALQGVEFARLEARLKAPTKGASDETAKTEQQSQRQQKPSKAPTPPKTQTRGAGGQFATKADTDDFTSLQDAWRQGKVR